MAGRIWIEDGNSVLAVMQGAGCIGRIWFTHSQHRSDGLLNLKKEHLRVYVDGHDKPALNVPLEDLFAERPQALANPVLAHVGRGPGPFDHSYDVEGGRFHGNLRIWQNDPDFAA